MKRFLLWASPVLGVVLGLAGIVVFRGQPPAEAMGLHEPAGYVAPNNVQSTKPDASQLNTAPRPELDQGRNSQEVAGKLAGQ